MKAFIFGLILLLIAAGGYYFFVVKKAPEATLEPVVETSSRPTTQTYSSSTMGVSFEYGAGWQLNNSYVYDQFGQNKLIHGVSITIPTAMATGTNLGSDSRLSVEQLPRARNCTGDIYINANVRAVEMTIGSTTYSVASTTGAAAGNRYEEWIYAVKNSKPCTAVRYLIHSTVLENYPTGTVRQFDRAALLQVFDRVRNSLRLTATP